MEPRIIEPYNRLVKCSHQRCGKRHRVYEYFDESRKKDPKCLLKYCQTFFQELLTKWEQAMAINIRETKEDLTNPKIDRKQKMFLKKRLVYFQNKQKTLDKIVSSL